MTPTRPIRRPLEGLSPYDLDAVQRWALQQATDTIIRRGGLPPRLVLVHDDHLSDIDLLAHPEGDPIQTLLGLADRGDIEHRLLFGCYEDQGAWRAWVFGARRDEEGSFWLASSPFEVQPGGVGQVDGQWELLLGVELAEVPFPAATLKRPGPAMSLLPAAPANDLQLGCITHDIPAGAEPPRDAVAATDVVSQLGFEKKAWTEGLDGRMIFVFHESSYDVWEAIGEIPFGLDDLVRTMCAMGDAVLATVVLSMDVVAHEGEHYRAVKMVSEANGVRFQRMVALLYEEGNDDEPARLWPFGAPPQPVGRDGWIGVEPITELRLFAEGVDA